MGKKYVIDEATLRGIADAIRAKTGKAAPIPVTNMASEINSITTGGGDTSGDGRVYLFQNVELPYYENSSMLEPMPEEGVTYYAIVTRDDDGETIEFEATCMDGNLGLGDGEYFDFGYESGRGWFMWDLGIGYSVSVYYASGSEGDGSGETYTCPICGGAYTSEESASECESSHAVEVTCEPHLSEDGILTFTHSGWDEYENSWHLYDAANDEIIAEEIATCFTDPVDLSEYMEPGTQYYVVVWLYNSDGVSATSAMTDSVIYGGSSAPQPWALLFSTSGYARLVGSCDEADYELFWVDDDISVGEIGAMGNDCNFVSGGDEYMQAGNSYYVECKPMRDGDYHGPVKSNTVVYDGNTSYLAPPATPECFIDMGDLAMRTSSLDNLGAVTVICWVNDIPYVLVLNQNVDTSVFWENGDGMYENTGVVGYQTWESALNELLEKLGVSREDVTVELSLVAHGADMSGNFSSPSNRYKYN